MKHTQTHILAVHTAVVSSKAPLNEMVLNKNKHKEKREKGELYKEKVCLSDMVMSNFNCVDQWFPFRDKLQKSTLEFHEGIHVLGHANAQITSV